MIVHEAAAAAVAVYHALIAWLIVAAVFASMVAGAAVACIAPGTRAAVGAWRLLRARVRRELQPHAPREPRGAPKPAHARVPSWAHTQPIDCEEAA